MTPKFITLWCFLVIVPLINGVLVGIDYFSDALRTHTSCSSKNEYCQIKCGLAGLSGFCLQNQCYCLTALNSEKGGNNAYISIKLERANQRKNDLVNTDFRDYDEEQGFDDDGDLTRKGDKDSPEYLDTALLLDKLLLRHHIAHFCPNLDVARDCIRTCMTQGKPAFCGKDHVCYCGHKYSANDRDPETNVSSVYSQFRDMYEKYFGPKYKPDVNV